MKDTFIQREKHKHSAKNKSVSHSPQQPQKILSLSHDEVFLRKRRIVAWSVRAIIFWGEAIVKAKREKTFVITLSEQEIEYGRLGESITIYEEHFDRLKNFPKPARDQLIILLSTEMGLRSGEVASLRIEYINAEKGSVLVRDSKKYKLYPIPLTYEVACTIQELLANDQRTEGWVIQQHERCAWRRGPPITTIGLCHIWKTWARKAGIPNWKQYTPTLGRHRFAAWWHYIKKGNLEILRRIMRHKHLSTLQEYLQRLIFYHDVKAEMQRLQTIPTIETNLEGCVRSEICKFYEPAGNGCKFESICKHRQEVQTH